MTKLIAIVFIGLFFSCDSSPSDESIKAKLEQSFRSFIDDMAFKEKQQYVVHNLTCVSYEVVDQAEVDTFTMLSHMRKIEYWSDLGKRYSKVAQNAAHVVQLSDDSYSQNRYKQEFEEHRKNMLDAYDSMQYWIDYDSVFELRRALAPSDKKYYKGKFFAKIETPDENVLDTIELLFDEQFRYVDVR